MRASVPLSSVITHTLSAPMTMDPSEFATPVRSVAVIAPVLRSRREMVWSPQFGTHRLPNPAARPEHGFFPAVTVVFTVFDAGSSCETLSRGSFDTQAVWAIGSIASQSGLPGTGYTASGFSRSMGILTPGALTPGFGGCCTITNANAAKAAKKRPSTQASKTNWSVRRPHQPRMNMVVCDLCGLLRFFVGREGRGCIIAVH